MNTEVRVTFDLSRRSTDADAYRTNYAATEDPLHALRQIGEVWNNVVTYRGVYPTRAEAEDAARAYRET